MARVRAGQKARDSTQREGSRVQARRGAAVLAHRRRRGQGPRPTSRGCMPCTGASCRQRTAAQRERLRAQAERTGGQRMRACRRRVSASSLWLPEPFEHSRARLKPPRASDRGRARQQGTRASGARALTRLDEHAHDVRVPRGSSGVQRRALGKQAAPVDGQPARAGQPAAVQPFSRARRRAVAMARAGRGAVRLGALRGGRGLAQPLRVRDEAAAAELAPAHGLRARREAATMACRQ